MFAIRFKSLPLLILTSGIALAGCDQLGISFGRHTHLDVEKCLNKNNSKLVSTKSVKRQCVKKYERSISYGSNSILQGKASLIFNDNPTSKEREYKIEGRVRNESDGYIVTSFTIEVTSNRNLRSPLPRRTYDDLWLQPGQAKRLTIELGEIESTPEELAMSIDWDLEEIKGIDIAAE